MADIPNHSGSGAVSMSPFTPDDQRTCAPAWQDYKREFLVRLDAAGLHDTPGRRKVGNLLKCMGIECIKIYDTFEWAPEIPAVEANVENNIEARPAVPAEDKHNLEHVLLKFDQHWGVQRYRTIKRQEFLATARKENQTIMDYIAELKRKAEHCDFRDNKDSFICDKIINSVNNEKCSERLLDLPDDELTLNKVTQICRQVELTTAHLKKLTFNNNHSETMQNVNSTSTSNNRGRQAAGPRRFSTRGRGYQGTLPFCPKCCRHHFNGACPAAYQYCGSCGQIGHYSKSSLCSSRGMPRGRAGPGRFTRAGPGRFTRGSHPQYQHGVNYTEPSEYMEEQPSEYMEEQPREDNDVSFLDIFSADVNQVKSNGDTDWLVTFKIKNKSFVAEIDTAAQCNVVSLQTVKHLGLETDIQVSKAMINGVHDEAKQAYGEIVLPCNYKGVTTMLKFFVMNTGRDLNLLGRSDSLRLGLIMRVNSISVNDACKHIVDKYSDVLGSSIGCLPGEYTIKIDPSVPPVIHPPRTVPVALREQVKTELDKMEKKGIIAKVHEPTEWVSSMVTVRKKNGEVRICIDPSDLNRAILREHFPMGDIDDIITRLAGAKVFSTLDANSGYFQIKLSENSSMLTTFNSPFGRYRYLRMPMGAKCSAEVFQREMKLNFGDLEGVEIVVDDILVHGRNMEEHNARLEAVLARARKLNLKLNSQKSHIGKSEVNYVGHRLTANGVRTTEERIKAITQLRDPTNLQEVETILGMVGYIAKFIPYLSNLTAPLRDMKKEKDWHWGPAQAVAFQQIKQAVTTDPLLKYYDVRKPVLISVDASTRGLGAALIQEGGVVAYASRALTPAETRYAQIEKEALAVVFACNKFHKLIYGKANITIESDHKPLEAIMTKPIHKAPMRIQKMLLKLQPYDFKLVHVSGKCIGLADCLSRLPIADQSDKLLDDDLMICAIEMLAGGQHAQIARATKRDPSAQELIRVIRNGWPNTKRELAPEIRPYWEYRDELSIYNGLIVRGDRTLIPAEERTRILKLLHQSHLGVVNTKQRARDLVFWPGMNAAIEEEIAKCTVCLNRRRQQPKEPLTVHPIPSRPWSKVGVDIFEIEGGHFIVAVDYYSNYIEVAQLDRLSSVATIKSIKRMIATHGIMDILVSDNGPQFASRDFAEFTSTYGIKHTTSSPQRPQANGLAEKAVQTIKSLMIKCSRSGDDFHLALLDLRNTPRENIGSPAQRLMGRRTQTRIPTTDALLKPQTLRPLSVTSGLSRMRATQKHYYDHGKKPLPCIKQGSALRIRTPEGWKPAEYIREHEAPNSHIVKAGEQGRLYRRNRDQLLLTREEPHIIRQRPQYNLPAPPVVAPQRPTPISSTSSNPEVPPPLPTPIHNSPPQPANQYNDVSNQINRPRRNHVPPVWMKDYVSK